MKILILSPNSIRIIVAALFLLVASTGCSSTTARRQLLRNEQYNKYHNVAPIVNTNLLEEHISGLQIEDAILARELMGSMSMSMSMSTSMSMHLSPVDIRDEIPTESPTTTMVPTPILEGRYDEPYSSSTISDIDKGDLVAPTTDDGFSGRLDQIIANGQGKDYEADEVPEPGPKPYFFIIIVAVVFFIAICIYCL